MESIGNKDKLLCRILDDARADAAKTAEQAADSVKEIERERDSKIAALVAEHEKKRDQAIAGIMDGNRTAAILASRREDLQSRREVIDMVFENTYQQLLKLDDDKRKKLYLSLLKQEALQGDVIVPAKVDRQILAQILPTGLTLCDEDAMIDGGFCIRSKGYEKDCSMASVLAQLRMDEETAVAKQLF